jgi:hypothetical protein
MHPLGEIVSNAADCLDEGVTGRGAGHEPLLTIVFIGARNAGDVAQRGRNALTNLGFEWIHADVLHHGDPDEPATDLVDTGGMDITDVRFVGFPEPFLLDRRVLRLDLPYFIAHAAMLAPLEVATRPLVKQMWHNPLGIPLGAASRG